PHFNTKSIIPQNILAQRPYRFSRDDYSEGILLDTDKNAIGHSIPTPFQQNGMAELIRGRAGTLDLDLHCYPDPSHTEIKACIAALHGLPYTDYVLLGVGSDEVIGLVMHICVTSGREKIFIMPLTKPVLTISLVEAFSNLVIFQ
ncbi:Histidinol-phosphate aminotransferase, partial [Leucoagaricus sp. SymC.cos]